MGVRLIMEIDELKAELDKVEKERKIYLEACIDLSMQHTLMKEKYGHLEAEIKVLKDKLSAESCIKEYWREELNTD